MIWFLVSQLAQAAEKHPVAMDVGFGRTLVAQDISELKYWLYGIGIWILIQMVTGGIKFITSIFWKDRDGTQANFKEMKDLLQNQTTEMHEMKGILRAMQSELVHIRATKAEVKDVPQMIRDELEYRDGIRGK